MRIVTVGVQFPAGINSHFLCVLGYCWFGALNSLFCNYKYFTDHSAIDWKTVI